MIYRATYQIYQYSFTNEFTAENDNHAWHVFWAITRHTGEHVHKGDKGVLLALLRNRAHVRLNRIEIVTPVDTGDGFMQREHDLAEYNATFEPSGDDGPDYKIQGKEW